MADSGGSAATDAALAEYALEHMFDWAAVSSSMASMYVPAPTPFASTTRCLISDRNALLLLSFPSLNAFCVYVTRNVTLSAEECRIRYSSLDGVGGALGDDDDDDGGFFDCTWFGCTSMFMTLHSLA